MTMEAQQPLRIFCSYAHEDEEHLNVLREWLRGLERQGLIEWWHDREISPGWEWQEAIDRNLRTADIILLLVTPDFMASDYVFEKEIDRAIERHERGEARVIPIIVRPALWKGTSLDRLQALPKDAKPITRWPDRDEAWLDVAEGIRKAVAELLIEHQQRAKTRYREAVEEAWRDTKLSSAEAEALDVLVSRLGLSTGTATEIEHEVMGDTVQEILQSQTREEERQRHLEELYERGQQHMSAKRWQQALECFEEVQRLEPGYREIEELLSRVRQELVRSSTVTVPDLGGQEIPQARALLGSSRLKLGGQHAAPSDTISEGLIIEQSPEAGTEVEVDSSVSVTISLGSQTATAADSLSQVVTEPEHTEPSPSGYQSEQHDSGRERVGSRTGQREQIVGQSSDRTERVGPDYSTDTQPQPTLPMLGRNWWALALAGLINAIHGVVDFLFLGGGAFYRLSVSSLLIAIGVFIIIASTTAHPRLLLRTQGIISGSAGLVAFLSGALIFSDSPANYSSFTEVLQYGPFFVIHISAFALWGICIGIIQIIVAIIVAIRLGWDFRVMRLMLVSGTFVVLYGIRVFDSMVKWVNPGPWLLAILLLVSGTSLVAFAFKVRQREESEVGA